MKWKASEMDQMSFNVGEFCQYVNSRYSYNVDHETIMGQTLSLVS